MTYPIVLDAKSRLTDSIYKGNFLLAQANALLKDGSIPLTANWNAGSFDITLRNLTASGTVTGTTLVTGPIQDKGGQVFNVKAYGALGDGSNDDTTAINAAYTAASAGGTVYFPVGTYIITAALTPASNTITTGVGSSSVIKVKTGVTGWGAVIQLSGLSNCIVRDLAIDGNKAAVTGTTWGIITTTGSGNIIENVHINNVSDAGIYSIDVSNLKIVNNVITNINLAGQPNQAGIFVKASATAISDILIQGNTITAAGGNGIFVNGGAFASYGVRVLGNHVSGCGINLSSQGIYVTGTSTNALTDVVVASNNILNQVNNDGIDIVYCQRFSVTGNTAVSSALDGIAVAISNIGTICGNDCHSNGGNGILLTDVSTGTFPTAVTISGNSCYANNQTSGDSIGGISLYNCVGNNVTGNTASDLSAGAKQKYGIFESGASSDSNVISDNVCRYNVTSPYLLVGANSTLISSAGGKVGIGTVVSSYALDLTGNLRVTTGFGCNGTTPQTAYASGGALAGYVTGAFGLDSDAHMHSLYTLVANMRAALVSNGIMS